MKITCKYFISGIFAAFMACEIPAYAICPGVAQGVKCGLTELSNQKDCGRFVAQREETNIVSTKTAMPIRAPWPSREQMKRDQIAKSGGSIDLVFVGDSITQGWENKVRGKKLYDNLRKTYSILNLGYSGNRTENMIWRLENGELDGYKAKLFMVMAGTNNKEPAEEVAVGVRRILELIRSRQPQATIILLPIFPRGKSAADARNARNAKVNNIIRGFADGTHIMWCDFTSELRDSAGGMASNLSQDRLHLNETGYAIWLRHVLPYFKRICGR